MKIVTTGFRYLDIDGYAGCYAYAELLRLQGHDAAAVSTAPFNESVPAAVLSWGAEIQREYSPDQKDEFILVDISERKFFDKFVDLERVTEVIDHHPHPDEEKYWRARLGEKAVIEEIGAACTLIYEKFEDAHKEKQISRTSARLLLTGILDNTLNFGARITTGRDKNAYDQLMRRADLPSDWPAQYFSACEQAITSDLAKAVRNDVKDMRGNRDLPDWVGQLVIWDASPLLSSRRQLIADTMRERAGSWAVNVVSIAEGGSYLLAEEPAVQAKLSKILGITFQDGLAAADRLWLRKEIMKAAQK